jgi:hypothetical protein
MMSKAPFLSAAGLLAASLLTGAAQASPYYAVWNGTVWHTDVTGVSAGNTATITVTLDNGGSSAASQTWGQAGFKSIAFAFGSTLTTFVTPFGGSLAGLTGSWVTNAGGTLISVPSFLYDVDFGTDYTTNLAETPSLWGIYGANSILYMIDGRDVAVNDEDTLIYASSWTLSPANPPSTVPEIDAAASTGALTLLLGALGLAAERRRKPA